MIPHPRSQTRNKTLNTELQVVARNSSGLWSLRAFDFRAEFSRTQDLAIEHVPRLPGWHMEGKGDYGLELAKKIKAATAHSNAKSHQHVPQIQINCHDTPYVIPRLLSSYDDNSEKTIIMKMRGCSSMRTVDQSFGHKL